MALTNFRQFMYRTKLICTSFIVYFCFDYFIYITGFLKTYSFVGIKSFLPIVLGLNFGPYGVIGEILAIILKCLLINSTFKFFLIEVIIVTIIGIGSWFFWHLNSYTHRVHFRYYFNYVRYFLIIIFLSLISAIISYYIINNIAFVEVLTWNIFLGLLVGIPIEIIYAGIMNLEPILPPLYQNGKRIELFYDIVTTIDSNNESFSNLSEKIQGLCDRYEIDFKRTFEIQNITEELYLRIIEKNPDAIIDTKISFDVNFSLEYIFIGKKFNPLLSYKTDNDEELAGLKIIKHKALLAFYNYNYGQNLVHIVV